MRGLWAFLDATPRHLWPCLLRGDVGYGSDGIMSEAEARGLLYLFKVKRTGLAKELFSFLSKDDGWTDCGCGWEGREHRIRLSTWKLARRCIFIRRPNVQKSAAIPPERAQLPAPDGSS